MKVKPIQVGLIIGAVVLILVVYFSYDTITASSNSPYKGFYEKEEIQFVVTEVSAERKDVLGKIMRSSVTINPSLNQVPALSRGQIFVFVNGTFGGGPFGYQHSVLDQIPSDRESGSLMDVKVVSWRRATNEGSEIEEKVIPRELKSFREVALAQGTGEIIIIDSGVLVNVSIVKGPSQK